MENLKESSAFSPESDYRCYLTSIAAEPVSTAISSLLLRRVIAQKYGQEDGAETVTFHRPGQKTIRKDYFGLVEKIFPD